MSGRAKLDIVIPARGEVGTLGPLLASLLDDAGSLCLSTVVVLNGEEVKAMRAAAQPWVPRYVAAGHSLKILCCETSSKLAALNAGDAARGNGMVVYLDADARIMPGSLEALATLLATEEPRLAGLRLNMPPPPGGLAHGFAAVWRELPGVERFIGSGCYAVNAAGRRRWTSFPDFAADDAFVFGRFGPAERLNADRGGLVLILPEGRALARSVRRWRDGNRALVAGGERDVRLGITPAWLIARPHLWRHLPAFLLMQLTSRLVSSPVEQTGWRPERARPR